MKILAIDTSTKFLSLGLYANAKIYEYSLETKTKLSSLLSITVKRVLEAAGLCFQEIDYFACGLGPGSFTGIRIGLSAVKGYAFALNRPVVGISTLDILAKNAMPSEKKTIIPLIDAKRNLIYTSAYKIKNGALKRAMAYRLVNAQELYQIIKPSSIVVGDALILYKESILKNIKDVTILDSDYWYPQAKNIISLALERISEKKINTAFDVKPIYLYPKECQVRKMTNDKIQSTK